MFLLWDKNDHLAGRLTYARNTDTSPANCCGHSTQIMPLPARLTVLHQESQPRDWKHDVHGVAQFMEQVRCSTTPQIEQSIRRRQFLHKQIRHTASLTKNTRRRKHDSSPRTSANDRFHAQRSTKKAQMAHNTTLRWQLSPTPQAYRSFRKNRHWAIGSQAFKALTFILGVGKKNRCDRSTIAQSELCNRWRSVQNTNFHPGR